MSEDKQEVLDRWEECKTELGAIYDNCAEDWSFLHGVDQWSEEDKRKRERQKRPCLTLNQLAPYAKQVTNDIKQARLAIRVTPIDEAADIDTAEILQGIIRNIEKQSGAMTAYATAANCAVGAGIGFIKIETDYADEDTFDQEICIKRVLDFSSVMLDPASQELDGSDAEYAFVRRDYSKERFKEIYPDAEFIGFEDIKTDDENICVVEYYYKHYKPDTLYSIRIVDEMLGDVRTETVTKEQKTAIEELGVPYEILNERKTEYVSVKKCVYNGEEDPIEEADFPSKYIPIIPVIGEEVFINGKREFHSLIRQAKDAQKMYNLHNTAQAEVTGMQPKSPWIGPLGSFKSLPDQWANANTENYAALEYDIVYDENGQRVEPPMRQPPIQASQGLMQQAMMAKEDIRMAIGMPQANMGMQGNEVSGIAIRNRQVEGDNATYHFIDNLSASISHVGCILVDMIPRLYSERTIARILGEEGEEKNVPINVPFVKDEEGNERRAKFGEQVQGIYDLNTGKYDVDCDVGASYSSKRQETADKLIELINAKPEIADVTADLLFEALDLPKAKEIAKRLRSAMPPEMLSDDPQAEKLKAASQAIKQMEERLMNYEAALSDKKKNTDFEQHVKLQELDRDKQKLVIESQKAAADIKKTLAEIEKMRAETSGFNMEALQTLGGAVQGIASQVEDITSAMNIIFDAQEQQGVEEMSEPQPDDKLMESEE